MNKNPLNKPLADFIKYRGLDELKPVELTYEPGVDNVYCPQCDDYSLFWDDDEGTWSCNNCDIEEE